MVRAGEMLSPAVGDTPVGAKKRPLRIQSAGSPDLLPRQINSRVRSAFMLARVVLGTLVKNQA